LPSEAMISLVVGLGNPGQRYVGTRHNVGFEVVALVARQLQAESGPIRDNYRWASAKVDGAELFLAQPTTYMNNSGEAVRLLLADFWLEPGQLLVVVDDFNLPLGALRIREAGSDGGHNGLASVCDALGTQEFARLRLGTGPVADNMGAADFALSLFEPQDQEKVQEMVAKAAEAVIFAVGHRLDLTMSEYNRYPAPPEAE
jgi:PTH1 family peptidyl-tRNA hydrolase